MMFIGARGGGGGKGNRFYMSAENTAPTAYEEGGEGQKRILHIELRVIAHAGLVNNLYCFIRPYFKERYTSS